MNNLIKRQIFILILFFGFHTFSKAQKTNLIEFDADGKMTVAPPNTLSNNDFLIFKVNYDREIFEKRVLEYAEYYFTVLTNLENFKIKGYELNQQEAFIKLKDSLGKELCSLRDYLSKEKFSTIEKRLAILNFKGTCSTEKEPTSIIGLIIPEYRLQITSICKNGTNEVTELKLNPDTNQLKNKSEVKIDFISEDFPVLTETETIEYKLVETDPINSEFLKLVELLNLQELSQLKKALGEIKKNLNGMFFKNYKNLEERFREPQNYHLNPGLIDASWVTQTKKLLNEVETPVTNSLTSLNAVEINSWIIQSLKHTKGIPKTNPFYFQASPLFPELNPGPKKISENEKAMVDIFENLVSKNGFQINDLSEIFNKDQLGLIAEIKVKIQQEKSAPKKSIEYDRFLYGGVLKPYDEKEKNSDINRSGLPVTYMFSHNATRDFSPMWDLQKEVKENDRVFIAVHNQKENLLMSVGSSSVKIEKDDLLIFEELNLDGAFSDKMYKDLEKDLEKLAERFNQLRKQVQFLTSLQEAPVFPISILKDETPEWKTGILNYSPIIEAPSIAEYQIKTGSGSEEKEVYKGKYRVNKLYNLRFKAGTVYSWTKLTDYSQSADNSFSVDNTRAGMDGTFGVQIFPYKTDLRQINLINGRVAPFIYLGLSMKNIRENFYPGLGLELFSGLAVCYNLHIVKTEGLIGNGTDPLKIGEKWGKGSSVSILVDGSLFVNLFKFGSNKTLLGL